MISAERIESMSRIGSFAGMVAAVGLSLFTRDFVYMGLLLVVPPLAGLGWREGTILYVMSGIGIVLEVFGLIGSATAADGLILIWFVILMVGFTWLCNQFLQADLMRAHAQRQILEDLDDSLARMREDMDSGKKALTQHGNRQKRYILLQEAAKNLGTSLDLKEVSKLVVSETAWLVIDKAVASTLFVFDGKGREITREQFISKGGKGFEAKDTCESDPLNQWVVTRRTPLIVKDLSKDFRFKGLDTTSINGKCFLISPLLVEGKVTGLIRIASPAGDAFDTEDQRLLESLVSLASLALENAKLFKETEELAITDGLTKLLLRRPLLERLDDELKRSEQRKSSLACILLDIDHFKLVNDTYGHPVGDDVLRVISSILQKSVRDVDLVGRYGGEEFAILLPETDVDGGKLVAERIREAIAEQLFVLKNDKKTITVSLGVSVFPDAARDIEHLIKAADEALYHSKETGRNRTTTWKEIFRGRKDEKS